MATTSVWACSGGTTADGGGGDGGSDGGGGAPGSFVSPTGFDEGCVSDDDCIGVEGFTCVQCPPCFPTVAVTKKDRAAYQAKQGAIVCPPPDPIAVCPKSPCDTRNALTPACSAGTCVLRAPPGSSDAGRDAETGG